jgi:serine/threonine-protein kinase
MPSGNLPSTDLPSCPADSVLARLIAGDLVAEEALILEAHLTLCASCRTQIESLGEVPSIEALAGTALNAPEVDSPNLRGVMERLLIESQLMSGSINFAANPTRDVLPTLKPSVRPGFIGRLGDIDIRQVIGRGGMGVVFEGEDSILNRNVAVKVLSPHFCAKRGLRPH